MPQFGGHTVFPQKNSPVQENGIAHTGSEVNCGNTALLRDAQLLHIVKQEVIDISVNKNGKAYFLLQLIRKGKIIREKRDIRCL